MTLSQVLSELAARAVVEAAKEVSGEKGST